MKMILPFDSLKANPFRDFHVDPIDGPENDNSETGYVSAVTRLRESIEEDGFWGGVVVRSDGNGAYEIAAGHHRIEAAKLAGLTQADLVILPMDDDAMIRVYGRENATQRGQQSTAIAGTVAAALRKVLKDNSSSAGHLSSSSHGGSHVGDQAVGRPAILGIIGKVPGIHDGVVRDQLSILKSSGDYRRITEEVAEEARLNRERMEREAEEARKAAEEAARRREEAERRRRQAEEEARAAQEEEERRRAHEAEKRAELAAQQAREREEVNRRAAEQAQKRAQEAEQSAARAEKAEAKAQENKFDRLFDYEGVSKWLHNDNQIRAFKKWALGPGIAPYLPVDSQHLIAKAIAVKATKEGQELSAAYINREASALLLGAKDVERKNKKNQEALRKQDREDKARHWQADFSRNCRGMVRAGTELAAIQKGWPKNTPFPITGEFRTALADAKKVIDKLHKEISCED